jgi:aminoglycoside/choline kinase family phosphotransferase
MDTGPSGDNDPFVRIAHHLSGLGLSTPAILAVDAAQGLLLIEDLGDGLFARLIAREPSLEPVLYTAASGLLAELHRHPAPPNLPPLDATTAPPLISPRFDWYIPGAGATVDGRDDLVAGLGEAIEHHATPATEVLIHRDFHAENLLWLPDRSGAARVGLIDFQDAHRGHPAYDLVSLLEDARRDLAEETRTLVLRHYLDQTGGTEVDLSVALAIWGAQRNLRILGIFARLSMHFGKPHYIDLIPRVWGHLQRDLSHPAFGALMPRLPEPTPTVLQRLKDLCGTVPTP